MRERRVGRVALPARLVAGAAGAAILVTAAPPVYAQDDESGGGEVLCPVHDSRVADATAIVPTADGEGWWVLPDGNGQTDGMMTIRQVGADCTVHDTEAGSLAVEWQPRDPQDMSLEAEKGFLWIADIGDPNGERSDISMTQVSTSDAGNFDMTRYVYPDGPKHAEAFFLLPDRTPVFIPSVSGEAPLYSSNGLGEEYDTPLELAGTVALPEGAGAVTGAALNADASKVALRTDETAFEWDVADGDVIASMTDGAPRETPLDDGGGDIAYDAEGNFVTVAQTGDDAAPAAITGYTPAAAAAEEPAASEDEKEAAAEKEGPSLLDRILDLGFDTIVKILAAIAILGLLVMVIGIVVIRKYKKAAGGEDDDAEAGFAAEESVFGKEEAYDDPVDLGLDAGQPDADLGQVARGGVYGAPRSEPSGNVYGGGSRSSGGEGGVYGSPRPEPAGNVYGGAPRPAPHQPGPVYGAAREEPQYGAFEGGGHGSVYDNAGPGQSFAARPEPSGNVYGARPAQPAAPAGGSVYGGGGAAQGSVYGNDRSRDADEGYWGPPEGGPARGRGR
ncbi:hypothetical protein [Glycomyces paridis]|uniref:Uncharacterized protein n=1 Tax=Glycomyces paridis TaxID=2126555 RepID=A0A4S8PDW4_9ACTN|nr:hypothetical protein [Glycomyces paridis]THV28593.1 hypothetical protein E9998_10730 [Glycomyces paridis]